MAASSTVLQQQTSAYKYGVLQKKSPSKLAGWQRRYCILAVDMLLYYTPPKAEGAECGPMKGFVILKDVLDVTCEGDCKIALAVKGRAFQWKASSREIRDEWYKKLTRAIAVINCQDPQITKELCIDQLWSNELLGISLKDRRVVSINWDGARTHGWQLGDVCIKVGDETVTTQNAAVEQLRHVRTNGCPFNVTVMRYDHANATSTTIQPRPPAAEGDSGDEDGEKKDDDGAPDDGDGVIDPEEGREKM